MITKEISRKIGVLSFLAMVSVVLGHAAGESRLGGFIGVVTLFAVPWFFVVSGYFFIKSLNKHGCFALLKRKSASLLLPYLLWCFVGWLVFRPVGSGSGSIMGLCEIVGFAPRYPIGNLPLWYVRALMVFVLIGCMLSSFLRMPLRFVGGGLFAVLFMALWAGFTRLVYGVSPTGSPVFFLSGCLIAHLQLDMDVSQKAALPRVIGLVCAVLGCAVLLSISHVGLIGNLATCCAIIASWLLYDFVVIPEFLIALAPVAAFVYFMHGAFVFHLDEILLPYLPFVRKGWGMDVYYLVKSLVFLSCLVLTAFGMKRYFPRVYAALAGGR